MSCGIRLKGETSLNERTSLDERQALDVVVDAPEIKLQLFSVVVSDELRLTRAHF